MFYTYKQTKQIEMKYIIIAIITLNFSYSQVSVYLPLKTIHLNNDIRDTFVEGEGGNKGIVIGFKERSVTYSLGYIINSYGHASVMVSGGYTFNIGSIENIISGGMANGYEYMYEEGMNGLEVPPLLERNGLMPFILYSVKFPVHNRIGIQLNISPAYINYGVYFNINGKGDRWSNNRK